MIIVNKFLLLEWLIFISVVIFYFFKGGFLMGVLLLNVLVFWVMLKVEYLICKGNCMNVNVIKDKYYE